MLPVGCAAADYPEARISNGVLQVKLLLPDAHQGYYRGTRFDWSGAISSLQFQGHEYFGKWFDAYDPRIHDAIMGPVEEFLTNGVGLGYEEAKPGESFVKIGVGAVRKPEEPAFRQFGTYEITDNGKWTIRKGANSVEFTQKLPTRAVTPMSIRRLFGCCRVSRRWRWSTACGIPAGSPSLPAFTSIISSCWTTNLQALPTPCGFRSRFIRRPICMGWQKPEAWILRT